MKSIPSVRVSFVLSAITLALLCACGGGGDGGGGSHFTGGSQSVTITPTNQTPVARAAVAGGFAVAQTQTSGTSTAASLTTRAHAVQYAIGRALDVSTGLSTGRRTTASASAHPAANGTATVNCAAGGSFTTSFTDKDNNSALSIGDVVTVTFNQCRDSSTESLSGTIAVSVTALTDADHFTATAAMQSLTVVENDLSSSINGSVTLAEANATQESDTTITVGSSGLAVATSSSSYSDSITFGNNTRIVTRDYATPAETTVTLDGTISSTALGGGLTLATLLPVLQLDNAAYPSAGQVLVTGANKSALLMTVLNATQVQLQLDADGDGKYEATSSVAWSSLL